MDIELSRALERAEDLKIFWGERNGLFEDERNFINLPQPRRSPRKGFVNVVMNEPKVLFETSVSLLSGFPPKFHLPMHGQKEEEKHKMNKAERFLTGVLREVDRVQMRRGREKWVKELSWYICGGWYAVFPFIDEDAKGNPIFRWEIYDPLTVYPWWGFDTLQEVSRVTYMDFDTAVKMAEFNGWEVPTRTSVSYPSTSNVPVHNYWFVKDEKVYNVVFVNEQVSKHITEETLYRGEIPIIVGGVAGEPMRASTKDSKEWTVQMGQSVIHSNRGMYEQLNRWVSLLMQIVQDEAYPPIHSQTKTGLPKIKPEDMASGKIITTQIGEPLEPFKHAGYGRQDVNTLLSLISQGIQRGGLPYVLHGNIPFEMSGFALSQLLAGLRHKLNPYMYAATSVISECALQTMRLYKTGGFSKINMVVNDLKGEHFIEEFSPGDMPETRFVEVDIPFSMPVDKNQLMAAARQALTPPRILSRETIWDTFSELGVEDKEIEYQRIVDDELADSPQMKLIHSIEKLTERAEVWRGKGRNDIAQRLEGYAQLLVQQLQQPQSEPQAPMPAGVMGGSLPPERLGASRAEASEQRGEVPPQVEAAAGRMMQGMV